MNRAAPQKIALAAVLLLLSQLASAKTFQNSYVSFEVPDSWNCIQDGVAWTCTAVHPVHAKEAVIVLAAKVAGPEDNLVNFLGHLKEPKKITTKVGTPMPSQVMYAQNRMLAGNNWVQAQHLGSEIPEFYTLYLATVKEQLAILVSFSAERNHYRNYNPIFDKAIKTLKIVANQQLLFPKSKSGAASEAFGIQVAPGTMMVDEALPPPAKKTEVGLYLVGLLVIIGSAGAYWFMNRKKSAAAKKVKISNPPKTK